MAASGLDHLKNDYRRRFCRPSRVLDIDTKKGQNILNIIQDCFEEYSVDSSLGTNSTKSVLYSASKVGKGCIPSPHKERQCQKLPRESVQVSSEKKEGTLQLTEELGHAVNRSVQIQDVHEKILTTNVSSKNKPDSRRMSSRNQKDHHDEEKAEFYLSPSVDQKKETYTSENSVNKLSSSTKISLKTKKRLNFEDIDVSKKTEVESIVTEEPQQRTPSGASQKVVQELEYDQPQTAKCFSTLFLETFRRKDESSPVVKCAVTTPPPSSPISDMKLLEDEFVIEESDRSVDGKLRFTIPRKAGRTKQNTGSSAERTATILQSKKSRGEHPSQSATLTQDTPAKACPGEKSQPTAQTKLAWDHVITDEMENNCRSSKSEIHSKNAEKSSVRKRTRKENQRSNLKACVVEEQVAMEQTEDKNINRSSIAQDKLRRNLDLNVEESGKMSSDHISPKQMQPVGSNKSKTSVPFSKNQKKEREHKKKHSSNRSKMNKLVPEEGSLTARRSQRVSRPPSDWWIVKSDQSDDFGSSSPAVDELPLHRSSRQKPVKANNGPGSPGEKLMPHTEPQTDTRRKPRAQKVSESAPSRESTPQTSSSQESLGSKEADLAKKKKSPPSGRKGNSEARNSIAVQNVHLPSRTSECTTPSACNSESGEAQISFFEESGPSRVKNHLSAKNNSDVDDTEVFENSNASRVKECKEIPENEIHHKLVLPTDTPNVRRTKRIRLRRLEYWRGERADYRIRPSGGCVVAGILSPDTVSSKRKAKENTGKVNRKYNGKRMCLGNDERTKKLIKDLPVQLGDPLQPTLVKDPDTKELVLLDLIRQRDSYQFLVQHNELKVYKTLDTPFFSTGKLVLGPHQEKGKQHVGSDILVFYVNFGELLCTLHETPYIITTGDSFYIPSGNYYNIKNLLNEESIILFTQIKR